MRIADGWDPGAQVCLHTGDTRALLDQMPDAVAQLVITSPPYNQDKPYERDRPQSLDDYVADQAQVIEACVRVLRPGGSLCWQVGNHVRDGEIVPLDCLLYPIFHRHDALRLRNRVVWHFEHGLHCRRRFSGRHETILWFTKGDDYVFDVDPLRVPQKYPGKRAWKGPHAGEYTGNPAGKNPGDVWIFPNVKANHVEKTTHPCQFPVELVERLVLSLTDEGDVVLDPYLGVGSSVVAALRHSRKGFGCDIVQEYIDTAWERVSALRAGSLRTRPMGKPVYDPSPPRPGRKL